MTRSTACGGVQVLVVLVRLRLLPPNRYHYVGSYISSTAYNDYYPYQQQQQQQQSIFVFDGVRTYYDHKCYLGERITWFWNNPDCCFYDHCTKSSYKGLLLSFFSSHGVFISESCPTRLCSIPSQVSSCSSIWIGFFLVHQRSRSGARNLIDLWNGAAGSGSRRQEARSAPAPTSKAFEGCSRNIVVASDASTQGALGSRPVARNG